MKLPVFHKYYTVNILIYLLLINIIVACISCCFCLIFIFDHPLSRLDIFFHIVHYLNIYVLPIVITSIIIESILRLVRIIKTNLHTTVQWPIFHKFYTINFLVYTTIINFILIFCYPLAFINLLFFKGPIYKEGIIQQIIFYLNMYIIPITIVSIILEFISAKTKTFIRKLEVIRLSRGKSVAFWIFISILFLFFLLMNDICRDYAIPYTPEELEQLRYD